MLSHFFIDRPIFASVVSIVITLTGAIALVWLPIAQYPQITPPAIQVQIVYPGASAQVVADTVAAPIEQQVNGVEGMLYMSSQMGNDGSYSLSVTFDVGTNLNAALVMVQNRVTLAMPQLPTPVQNQGITIRKRTPDILLVVNFYSKDGRYDDLYLSNYATINVYDELLRVDGVSDVHLFGQRDYSIRVWLDPQKMAAYGINAGDVASAIGRENIDLPAGRIGQPPAMREQAFDVPIDGLGRLSEPEQFADIIVKVDRGQPVQTAAAAAAAPVQAPSGLPQPGAGNPQGGAATGTVSLPTALGSLRASASLAAANATTAGATGGGVSGGGSTGGGANTGGGGMSGGGATAAGGATTGSSLSASAAAAGAASATTTGSATGSELGGGASGEITGLAINNQTTAVVSAGGAIPGTTLAGGPPKPSVGIVRLRNVGRVEMGAQNYRQASTFDGHPSVGVAVFQLPGTNALDVATRVREKMTELSKRFPEGVDYQIAYDTTPFIRESVQDVFKTLIEAALLVGLVVLVFLQNWRSALIPLVAVPVAIVGTFAVMAAVGFSLNNISMFGLVLAIGIVVDDAIVVVENVERWIDHGLTPRDATYKAMEEVTGPVIAVALVLCAVFVPCAFISGITGRFFRQFAVTIAASTVFSAINSLTFSPALAAILLRPRTGVRRDPVSWLLQMLLGWFFELFNWAFGATTAAYAWTVGRLVRTKIVVLAVLAVYGVLLVLTYTVFQSAPRGYVPDQDQGRIMVAVQLPDSASLERTKDALAKIDEITRHTPGVAHALTVAGFSFVQGANGSNFGSMFIILDPFEKRRAPELKDQAIMARLRPEWARQVKDAQVLAFGAPPIPGLSVAGGFKIMVEDRAGLGLATLQRQTDELVRKLQQQRTLVGVSTQFRSTTPQLFMDIDRTKVASLGIPLDDVNQTLEIYLGSLYVTNFNAFGRHWQVNVQAAGGFRDRVDDVNLLKVRNNQGDMVPLGALGNMHEIGGPIFVNRYNLYTAASISGSLRPGVSSGEVIKSVDKLADDTLSLSMNKEWTELMFMQIRAGDTTLYVFALAVACVFLALAALYESWSLPLAVILVVPLCLLCSVVGVLWTKNSVNIFVQIGLVVLVGLACKNSILIVEFAKRLRGRGQSRHDATQEASRLRLRPILMTSFAFIFGVMPLVVASGAGSEMRRSLGTAVFSGMLGVTLFGIFLTPVFFYVICGLSETRLFMAVAMQWISAVLLGALLGAGVGFSLSRIGLVDPTWALATGAGLGILAAMVLQTVHRRVVGAAPPGEHQPSVSEPNVPDDHPRDR